MKNHCVVSKLHSDFILFCLSKVRTTTFDYNFTIAHSKSLCTGSATPEEQLGRHEILREPSGLRALPQDDNERDAGGYRPLPPTYKCEHYNLLFLRIIHRLFKNYNAFRMQTFSKFVSMHFFYSPALLQIFVYLICTFLPAELKI